MQFQRPYNDTSTALNKPQYDKMNFCLYCIKISHACLKTLCTVRKYTRNSLRLIWLTAPLHMINLIICLQLIVAHHLLKTLFNSDKPCNQRDIVSTRKMPKAKWMCIQTTVRQSARHHQVEHQQQVIWDFITWWSWKECQWLWTLPIHRLALYQNY